MRHHDGTTINSLAHTTVENCYQCGKCSAGCPVAERMDLMPNQIVRLAQVGDHDRAVRTRAIWTCVSCQTCSERCPKGVDVAAIMDAFRRLSARSGRLHPRAARTVAFQRAFQQTIRRNGRLNELELTARFKSRAFALDASVPRLVQDATLAPRLVRLRKLRVRGERPGDPDVARRIVDRCLRDGTSAQE